jgi:3-hydroxyacyl-[acyl-carrier-protein] dehydratase
MQQIEEILPLIPHRPPFLWIDRIISISDDWIITEKDIAPDLDILRGHYPGNPIMPGAILCEAVFQSGALLIAKRLDSTPDKKKQIPVLTRINGAKFKRQVYPGDTIQIKAILTETVSTAYYFKGKLKVAGKVAMTVDFVCAMVPITP